MIEPVSTRFGYGREWPEEQAPMYPSEYLPWQTDETPNRPTLPRALRRRERRGLPDSRVMPPCHYQGWADAHGRFLAAATPADLAELYPPIGFQAGPEASTDMRRSA